MTAILCSIWPYLFGALLGWLGAGLLVRLQRNLPPGGAPVVAKISERVVDNPQHLERIRTLESEVAAIAGLRAQIQKLQSTPPKTVEKIVERIVEVTMPDVEALDAKDREITTLRATLSELDAELQRLVALNAGAHK